MILRAADFADLVDFAKLKYNFMHSLYYVILNKKKTSE